MTPAPRRAPKKRAATRSTLDAHFVRLAKQEFPTVTALARYLRELPVAALATDNAGAYVIANPSASKLTGYSPAELRSMCVWDLTHEEHETDVLWRGFVQM